MNRTYKHLNGVGAVLHETATPKATDEAEIKYFNTHKVNANVHGFVDYNSIRQCLPWDERCMGAGPSANIRFIQIELCHFDGELFEEVWKRGVWFFAWIFINVLKIHNVTPENLMSHKEVSEKWHETDHTDPYGFFQDNGKTVDDFRAAVQEMIDNMLGGDTLKVGTKELPEIKTNLNGIPVKNAVLINVDGRSTTYIPAVALRDAGIAVTYNGTSGTVSINTK